MRKAIGVKHLGGTCERCGLKLDPVCFDFHHPDPNIKEVKNTDSMCKASDTKFYQELVKCYLLCANCHRLIHAMEQQGEAVQFIHEGLPKRGGTENGG